jgi:hypothetical protein
MVRLLVIVNNGVKQCLKLAISKKRLIQMRSNLF